MQVCTSLQTDNHASTPPLSFLQAGCPSCRPTNSVKALMVLTSKLKKVTPAELTPWNSVGADLRRGVDVGAMTQQDADDVSLARSGSHMQRRLVTRCRGFQGRVGVVKQVRHHVHVTHERSDVQRSESGLQSSINTRVSFCRPISHTLK